MNYSVSSAIDYLVIGHLTVDVHETGDTIGGTAAYASKTALALGRKPAVLTSYSDIKATELLNGIHLHVKKSRDNTRFKNIETKNGRKQFVLSIAEKISQEDMPETANSPGILHLGPVADEIDPAVIDEFPAAFVGVTPQGWMRQRGEENVVNFKHWDSAQYVISRSNAVVISVEDVRGDEELIQEYAQIAKVLAVTEGDLGARIYWHGDVRHFSAPQVNVVDPTGAGDIFAAVFFDRLEKTSDAWAAAEMAVNIASNSVTRRGLAGVPYPDEVIAFQIEVI